MKECQWQLCDQGSFLNDVIFNGYRILYRHYLKELEASDFHERHDTIQSYFGKIGAINCRRYNYIFFNMDVWSHSPY